MQFANNWFHELTDFFSSVAPQPLAGGRLFYVNQPLARQLAIPDNWFEPKQGIWWGEALAEGMAPLAQCYSGHQFGVWAGQLGDGRGLLLGEQITADGKHFDWHLKGAGLTPYSRMGDGRAVIRSSVREFLASEAMHGLSIPTTRGLTLAISDEPVYREQTERAAMLMRIAESHLRFGHFEHWFYQNKPEKVRQLADFTIRHHWPELVETPNSYLLWFTDIVRRTARLIADWQSVGFAHGVMNTDNMSILGLTLDYGPFGFMDNYDPDLICNHSDYQGRYSFDNQPMNGLWNLNRLAHALSPLLTATELKQALSEYEPQLMSHWAARMRAKLGLSEPHNDDNQLLIDLFKLMAQEGADYTRTFRLLSYTDSRNMNSPLRDEFIDRSGFDQWFTTYRQRLSLQSFDDQARQQQMLAVNPAIVLRNYLAEEVIQAAEAGDSQPLANLHNALIDPYQAALEASPFFSRPPEWAQKLEVSCSS